MKLKTTQASKPWWIALGGSVLILAVSSYAVSSHTLSGGELSLFRSINDWPGSLHPLFFTITQLGSAWTLYAVTLLMLWKHRYRLALRLFLAGALASGTCELLKQLIGRPRPDIIVGSLNLRDSVVIGKGFPSGHTALATALALMLWPVVPRQWRWVLVVWVAMVGVSRVYLGVHAPLDIVGGIAVGLLIVSLSKVISGKLRFVTKITGLKLR
jgi:glycosyltransferase 2 family protein